MGLNIEDDKVATYEGIREYLEGDCGLEEIERTYAAVGKMGINSIPNFIIIGTHIIRGAAWGGHEPPKRPIFQQTYRLSLRHAASLSRTHE